jgi:signal peptidase I
MVDTFTLVLLIAVILTGVLWVFYRFKSYKCNIASKRNSDSIIKRSHDRAKYLDNQVDSNLSKNCELFLKERVACYFPVLCTIFIFRSFIYEPFHIPSGSMMPNLLVGDLILVEKFSYGIKDPITKTKLVPVSHPKRGEVAVFRYPNNQKLNYIKRIIGLPGDKIVYNPYNKTLSISPIEGSGIRHPSLNIDYNLSEISDINVMNQTYGYLKNLGISEIKESLGEHSHKILVMNSIFSQTDEYYHQDGQQKLTWVIPKGKYFVMGDNRDNSLDSRYWGFVSDDHLVGKATIIWMSFEKQQGEWPTGIRWGRIGNIV